MPQLLYEDFDELTVPNLPGAAQGETITVVSGTWVTGTHSPVSGANDLENTTPTDDNQLIWTAPTSGTNGGSDHCVQFTQLVQYSGTSGQVTAILLRLSGNTNSATGYLVDVDFAANPSTISVYKKTGAAAYTQVGSSSTFTQPANGTEYILKAQISGSTISYKIWQHGTSEPGSWLGSVTDSTYTTGTAWGLRTGIYTASVQTWTAVDDLFFGDPNTTFGPWGTTYTLTAPSPASGYAGTLSQNFTIQMSGGPVSATTTFTPSDGAVGGTFTPTTVQITTGNSGPVTFQYTPPISRDGNISISCTHSGATLTDPAAVTYDSLVPLTTVSPFSVLPNTTGATLTLTGTGTSWASSGADQPNWTVSGVAGVTIPSPHGTVSSTTSMSLSINTGSATGLATFTNTTDNSTFTLYVSATTTVVMTAPLGTANSGLVGTVGVTVLASNGTVFAARTTSGISEMAAGSGDYITSITVPTIVGMGVVWDTGGASPSYFCDEINPSYS